MILLAIDTTSELGSLALARNGRLLEWTPLSSADGFAHILFEEIGKLLERHSLSWRSVEGFAAAAGPGAFTGVRVGLTAAKGLAEATGRQMVAVSNLQALAWFGTAPLRAPILDARRGDIFGAVYNDRLELVQPEVVAPLEEFLATLPAGAERILGPRHLAPAIAAIAASEFAAGRGRDPAAIDANYVRRADAELKWIDRT